jgi:dihydrofolate reductase
MRTVSYAVATSVDACIAARGEAMDWIRWSEDAAEINSAGWAGVDTILMGRKTFDFARRNGGTFGALKTYVFSRSLDRAAAEGSEVVSGDAASFVRGMKSEKGGNILLMGGGDLASSLIAGGVVDEIALNIHPLLLGGGTRLIDRLDERVELELLDTRPLRLGCILARYRILS